MLIDYAKELLQNFNETEVLQLFANKFDFQKYIETSEYHQHLDRLIDHNHYDGSVVDIIGDRSSIILLDDERFTVSLSKRNSSANYVYTQPAPTLIVSLSHIRDVEVLQYRLAGSSRSDPVEARRRTIQPRPSIFVAPCSAWMPSSEDTLFKINLPADNSIWLTVYARRFSHYFHAYSTETFAHLFTAFSSHTVSSHYYISEILYHASRRSADSSGGLRRAARELARMQEMPVTGLWRMAEAMSSLQPALAIDLLEEMKARGGDIGNLASAKLQHLVVTK